MAIRRVYTDPPASNRGVKHDSTPPFSTHIDWLAASFPIDDEIEGYRVTRYFQRITGVENRPLGEVGPRKGFDLAMQFEIGRLDVARRNPPYAGFVLTGKDLAKIANNPQAPTDTEILARLAEYGGKPSRLDVAVNLFEPAPVDDLISAWEKGQIKTRARQADLRKDLVTGAPTLYVGSRNSELMLRVYDKAIESGNLGMLWTRLELEAKDLKAQSIMKTIINKGVQACGYWWRRFDFQVDWFDNAIKRLGKMSPPEPVKREVTHDKQWWLEHQILPALARIKQFEPETWEWFMIELNSL